MVGASSSQDGFSRYRFAFLAIFAAQSQSKPGRGPPRERPSGTPFPHPRSNVEPQLLSRNPSPRFLGPAKSHAIARKRHLKLLAHTAPRDLLLQWLERRKAMETHDCSSDWFLINSVAVVGTPKGNEKWTPKFGPEAKLDFSGSAGHEKTAEL